MSATERWALARNSQHSQASPGLGATPLAGPSRPTVGRAGLAAALLVALGAAGCSDDEGSSAGSAKLTLLFTSDEHSHLLAFRPEIDDFPPATSAGEGDLVGGAARRAALLEAERARAASLGAATLTLSGGDNTTGALPAVMFASHGLDYQILSALGYDATTIGNHELDYGPAVLASAIAGALDADALPPIVASNIRFDESDGGDDDLEALYGAAGSGRPIEPWRILTTPNGIRVGLVGWVGANAARVAPNKAPVLFSAELADEDDTAASLERMRADLQPIVSELRSSQQVDLVVGLGHAGIQVASSPEGIAEGEDYWLCENLEGLDLIVSGHSHNQIAEPIVVAQSGGRSCTVLHGGSYGELVGRVDLTVELGTGGEPLLDMASQDLLPVDDTIVPDPTMAAQTMAWIDQIEAAIDHGEPYLAHLMSQVEDTTITDDPTTTGDLYFRPLVRTAFAVEDNMMLNYLSADSMLAAMDSIGEPVDMALESAGVIRAGIQPGLTGVVALSDAFNVVPNGASPLDGTLGYPLVHVYIASFELRAIFEFSATLGQSDSDYLLGQAGVRVTYDKSRPPVEELADLFDPNKGWVMRIEVDSDHEDGSEQFDTVIYDREAAVDSEELINAVTSSYIAQFASAVGVTLKDATGETVAIEDAIVNRLDQSQVKAVEAFLAFLLAQPDGDLAERYDVDSADRTKRQVCDNGCD